MNELMKTLPDQCFYRIHRSTIVNLGQIAAINYSGNNEYKIVMLDNSVLQTGRSYQVVIRQLVHLLPKT